MQGILSLMCQPCPDKNLPTSVNHEIYSVNSFAVSQNQKISDSIKFKCFAGEVLWVSDEGIATESDIPKCESCGSERRFEFQVLPQLLNHLKVHLVVCHFMIHLSHLQTLKPTIASD